MKALKAMFIAALVGASAAMTAYAEKLTIATVNNSDMIIMQELSSEFTKKTGHELNWVTLEENVLRQRVTTDIATGGGQFDIITIGAYEAPMWGKDGKLVPLSDMPASYDMDDVFPTVRDLLSHNGVIYALPFYAESSFTFYRKDLFANFGLFMPLEPNYRQFRAYAEALHDPENGVYGVCLRGKAGWGGNMAHVTTMVNAFGGRWFDMNWRPQLDSPEWKEALTYYVDILNNFGPPGASSNGHNENRALFASGKCGMWVDATSAAGYIYNPSDSKVHDKTDFTRAPSARTDRGTGWAWAWALSIPKSSKKTDAAKQFLAWSTSKEYVDLVGERKGWTVAPPGTRKSTYNDNYYKAAPFARTVLNSIMAMDPTKSTLLPVPYTGVQFAAIPEFQSIGTQVGQFVAAAVAGQMSVDEALEKSQAATDRIMRQAGYY